MVMHKSKYVKQRSVWASATFALRFILACFIFFVLSVFTMYALFVIGMAIYLMERPPRGKLMNAPPPPVVNPRPTQ